MAGDDSGSDDVLARASEYHELAIALDRLGWRRLAETFHREAGIRMAEISVGDPCDRDRVRWAVCLADNLAAQERWDESRGVLVAALALAEGCFGPSDSDVLALRHRL